MKTRTRRLYTAAFILFFAFFAIGFYCVTIAIAWARTLPDRIVIDGDAVANAFGSAMFQSYHEAFRNGDPQMQAAILNDQLIPAVENDPAAQDWIRLEYRDDVTQLASSEDADVSTAASKLLLQLDGPPSDDPEQDGG